MKKLANQEQKIDFRINEWKDKLIDTSMKNRLLNFKITKANTLEIEKPEIETVFQVMSSDDGHLIAKFYDYEEEDTEKIKNYEIDVRSGEVLFKKDYKIGSRIINNIRLEANSSLEERGINVLYLSFGICRWYDSDSSDIEYMAPMVLIPIQIARESLNSVFQIVRFDDEIIFNPAFVKKLEQFGIKTNSLNDYNFEEEGVVSFLSKFSENIKAIKRWKITYEIFLSSFSYQKLDMYKDVETNIEQIKNHPFLSSIANGHYEKDVETTIGSTDSVKNKIHSESYQILDADSSQQAVIEHIKKGHDLVVQGPPGTGKSQTIVNIICELLGEGKKVLFVSEKQAALNVVKKRLDDNSLGIFCLELHSKKATKNEVLKQLEKRLTINKIETNKIDNNLPERLYRSREHINDKVNMFTKKFGHLKITAVEVYNQLINLKDVKNVKADIKNFDYFTDNHLDLIKNSFDSLTKQDIEIFDEISNLKKLKFKSNEPDKQEHLKEIIPKLLSSLKEYNLIYSKTNVEQWSALKNDLISILKKNNLLLPDNKCNNIKKNINNIWKINFDKKTLFSESEQNLYNSYNNIIETIQNQSETLLSTIKQLYHQFGTYYVFSYKDEVLKICSFFKRFKTDILYCDFQKQLLKWEGSYNLPLGKLFGGYKKNREKLFSLSRNNDMKEEEIPQILEIAKNYKQILTIEDNIDDTAIFELVSIIPTLFKEIEILSERFNSISKTLLEIFEAKKLKTINIISSKKLQESTFQNLEEWRLKMNKVVEGFQAIKENYNEYVLNNSPETDIFTFKAEIEGINEVLSKQKYLEMISRKFERLEEYQLMNFIPIFKENDIPVEDYSRCFLKAFYKNYINNINKEDVDIYYFDSDEYEKNRTAFAKLDFEQLNYNKKKLLDKMLQPQFYTPFKQNCSFEISILNREIKKKRNKLTIRKLFKQIPGLVQELKPCMLMSPLSVSHFLEFSSIHFDTVIFDEASQIFPEDSIGSIMRADQVVIVGDDKQLPPTTFFQIRNDEDVENNEDDTYQTETLESILDETIASGVPSQSLLWHYRSREESLIAFSNYYFYNNRLITFPSNFHNVKDLGVNFEYVEDGWYDRGKSKKNLIEAERICETIIDFAEQYPNKSLGVITFNVNQREAIIERLEWMRKQDLSHESFFAENRHEPFFVKNLENVQGDERDIIMFSVGYAKDRAGKMHQNFGPINQSGGERRLNVAVTRARERIIVFSSITHEDIRADKENGVSILREYLRYAESNGDSKSLVESINVSSEVQFDSFFEEDVYTALTKKGYLVDTQIGASGYRIDLAVRNPDKEGVYLLAIECDGTSFHSSRTARDRDRLRQSVLENLGWKFIRIWSKDWFTDPNKVLEKIIERIENEKNSKDMYQITNEDETEKLEITFIQENKNSNDFFKEYSFYTGELFGNTYNLRNTDDLIRAILKLEAPIHINELIRRLKSLKSDTEKNLRNSLKLFDQIITENSSVSKKKVLDIIKGNSFWNNFIIDNDFILLKGQEIVPRKRNYETKIDFNYIHPEEICEFIKTICQHTNQLDRNTLVFEVSQNLGFKRSGQKMTKTLNNIIDSMLIKSVLIEENGWLSCP